MIALATLIATYALGFVFLCWGDLVLWLLARADQSVNRDSFILRGLFACGIGGIVISSLTLGLGLAHLLYSSVLWAILAIGPLLSLATGRMAYLTGSIQDCAAKVARIFWLSTTRRERVTVSISASILLILAAMIHLLAAAPLYDPDGLTYHMAIPKLYVEQHAITPLYGINELGNKPFALDMWHVDALLAGMPSIGTMLSALCLLLLVATILAIAYHCLGIRSPAILLIAALVTLVQPMTATLATWSYVEVPLAWYEALLILALLRWLTTYRIYYSLMIGLFGGMLMASKESGLAALAGVTLVLLVIGSIKNRLRPTLVCVVAVGVAALTVAGPWLLRSIYWTGDITGLGFPLLSTLAHTITHNTSMVVYATSGGVGPAQKPTLLARFLLGWLPMSYAPVPPGLPFFPANPLLVLCPLPIVLRRNTLALSLSALALLHIYVWQRIPISYRQFYLYVPLLLVLAIWGWHLVNQSQVRRYANLGLGVLLTGLVIVTPLSLDLSSFFNFTLLHDAIQVAIQPSRQDQFLSRHVPGYRVDQEINRYFHHDASVRFLVVGFSYFYYLSVPYVSIKATPLFNSPTSFSTPAQVRNYLEQHHICGLLTLEQDFAADFGKGFDVPAYLPTAHALARLFKAPHFQRIGDGTVVAIMPMMRGIPSNNCRDAFDTSRAT